MSKKFKGEIESIDEAKELFYGLAEDRKQEKRAVKEAEREAKRLAKDEAKEEARRLKEEAKIKKKSEEDAEGSDDESADEPLKAASTDETTDSEIKVDAEKAEGESGDESEAEEGKTKRRYKGRKKRKEKVNIVRELYYLGIYIGVVIIVCFLIITFIGERTTVVGDSMIPTLQDGDNLWIDKISYRFSDPKRFDIVIFPPRNNSDKIYIKRVIGLPGETVQIDEDGNILIDGRILVEDYGYERIEPDKRGIASSPITLGKDEYFVLGDNRNNSEDSRRSIVGNVRKKEIIGKAVFRLSPLSKFGKIK